MQLINCWFEDWYEFEIGFYLSILHKYGARMTVVDAQWCVMMVLCCLLTASHACVPSYVLCDLGHLQTQDNATHTHPHHNWSWIKWAIQTSMPSNIHCCFHLNQQSAGSWFRFRSTVSFPKVLTITQTMLEASWVMLRAGEDHYQLENVW